MDGSVSVLVLHIKMTLWACKRLQKTKTTTKVVENNCNTLTTIFHAKGYR